MFPKRLNNHLWISLLILIATFFVWHKVLNQTPLGEGYYYFDFQENFTNSQGKVVANINNHDNFALLLFDVLPPVFGENLTLYLLFELVFVGVLNISLYFVFHNFTKNKWLGFSAVLIFLSSYAANFEMLGTGNYQRFVQRIPNLIPSLWGLVVLSKYFESREVKHFLLSLCLFITGLVLGQFSTFVLPLYIAYILISGIRHQNKSVFLKHAIIALLYFAINYALIKSNSLFPPNGVLSFLRDSNPTNLLKNIVLQLGNMTLPVELLQSVAAISHPFDDAVVILTVPVVLCLIGGLFIFKKQGILIQNFYFSCFISLVGLLLLNLYLGKINPVFNIRGYEYYFLPEPYEGTKELIEKVKGDRYYQLPYVLVAFMATTLAWTVFPKKSRRLAPVLVAAFIVYNTAHVWKSFDQIQYASEITKSYLGYIKSIRGKIQPASVIVTRPDFIWPSPFIRSAYGYPETQFTAYTNNEWSASGNNKDNYIILDFDYENNVVIDLTDRYRDGEEVRFLNRNDTGK